MPAGELAIHIAQAIITVISTQDPETKKYTQTLSLEPQGSDSSIFPPIDPTGETYTFGGNGYNIYQLGVQTLPGLSITIGENSGSSSGIGLTSSSGPIYVGQTGIFELNLNGKVPVDTQITINNLDILTSNMGDNVNYCIIDVVYYKVQGEGITT